MARNIDGWEPGSGGFDVVSGEFVVVTADAADCEALARLSAVLRRMRSAFAIDAVFVSEWVGGEPVLRRPPESANALLALYGRRLLEAPAPRRSVFRYEAMPVLGSSGVEYGTLCCRHAVGEQCKDESALQALHSVARLIAEWFDDAAAPVAA